VKRDWECIREILRMLEAMPDTTSTLHPNKVGGWSEEEASYHMHLLEQAGLIEATCRTSLNAPLLCMGRMLTWQGHELLDKLNSQSLWNTVKAYARDRSVELSFEAISILARKGLEELL
jgi:hypothetical protein